MNLKMRTKCFVCREKDTYKTTSSSQHQQQPEVECVFLYAVLMSVKSITLLLNYRDTVVIILMKTLTGKELEDEVFNSEKWKIKFLFFFPSFILFYEKGCLTSEKWKLMNLGKEKLHSIIYIFLSGCWLLFVQWAQLDSARYEYTAPTTEGNSFYKYCFKLSVTVGE